MRHGFPWWICGNREVSRLEKLLTEDVDVSPREVEQATVEVHLAVFTCFRRLVVPNVHDVIVGISS